MSQGIKAALRDHYYFASDGIRTFSLSFNFTPLHGWFSQCNREPAILNLLGINKLFNIEWLVLTGCYNFTKNILDYTIAKIKHCSASAALSCINELHTR